MKDRSYEPAPMAHVQRGPAGNCYFRGDVGYSVARNPAAKFAVTNETRDYGAPNAITGLPYTSTYAYQGDAVTDTSMDNSFFGGVGMGCGMGSRGVRGEVMLNATGARNFDGVPLNYVINNINVGAPPTVIFVDPVHSTVQSTTAMFNGYYDFGKFGAFSPYVGAGVGVAYNRMAETYFTDNPFLLNRIQGDSRISLAWSLMAGVGYQVTDRAVLDFGYRYMNYGKANSGQVDNAGFINPRVYLDDISAHEFKVGLRYHFGGNDCCAAPAYQPMK